jgi:hypothetical protein
MDLFTTAAAFPKGSHAPVEFDAWLSGLEKAGASTRKQDLTDYLEQTKGVFNSRMLYDGAGSIWHSGPEIFTLAFDSVLKIRFEKTDLVWASRTDSSIIIGTKGEYIPQEHMWRGTGGTITWLRSGLDPKKNLRGMGACLHLGPEDGGTARGQRAAHRSLLRQATLGHRDRQASRQRHGKERELPPLRELRPAQAHREHR